MTPTDTPAPTAAEIEELAKAVRKGHNDDCLLVQDVGPCHCPGVEEMTRLVVDFGFSSPARALAYAKLLRAAEAWDAAVYECQAATCKCVGKLHLKNLDAATPTHQALAAHKEAGG